MEMWELVARESVRDLFARCNANGDCGRWDQLEELFAPEMVLDTDGIITEGRDEVMRMYRAVQTNVVVDPTAPSTAPEVGHTTLEEWIARGHTPFIRHCTTTTQIDVISPEEARSRSYYFLITVHGLDHWGHYLDSFRPVDGTWKFSRRREIQDAAVTGGWGAGADLDNHVRVIGST